MIRDPNGRFLILDVQYEGNNYTLLNAYAPNADKPDFFQGMFNEMEKFPNECKIISGDFNLVLDDKMDLKGSVNGEHTHKNSIRLVNQYMASEEMVDVWRERHPNDRVFTFYRDKPQPYFAQLDFFFDI